MITNKPKRSIGHKILIALVVPGFMHGVSAQDVPADLLDLSLEELFAAEIDSDIGVTQSRSAASRWRFQMRHQRSDFEGYRDGSNELSIEDVMFHPGEEPRTDKNFPVVPSFISQKVDSFTVAYQASDLLALQLVVPRIMQSTAHFSVVPGYDEFVIESEGIGDIVALATYRLTDYLSDEWQLSFGLSIPTGSIDEEGDTPRAPGNQQIPYSMQLGSGTYDFPMGLSFATTAGNYSLGMDFMARIRLGKNDRDYSLGNRFTGNTWVQLNSLDWIKPSLYLSYEYSGEIDGRDTELLVPAAFPYPAPVTNPTLYGGRQANIGLGLSIPVWGGQYLDLDYAKPIYQSLNGPQVSEDYRSSVSMSFSF